MPLLNFGKLQGYESFLTQESFKNKLKFLRKTIYNTKQIKKTLDLRKLADLERTRALAKWKEQPERIIRQRINIRRIKLRVKNRLHKQLKKQDEDNK